MVLRDPLVSFWGPQLLYQLAQNNACSIASIAYNCAMDLSVKQLEEAVAVRKQIDQLRSRLNSLLGSSSAPSTSGGSTAASPASRAPRKRRGGLSAAGRARIAAAARARWARVKAGKASSSAKPAGKKSGGKKKGGISAAGRRKLSQMMKARWAARRRAQG